MASDLVVSLAQLCEVPAAERSAERAHEDEDDVVAVAVVTEPDSPAAGTFEAEVGRLAADGDTFRFDRHQRLGDQGFWSFVRFSVTVRAGFSAAVTFTLYV